jgi:hypothetical protein
MPATTLNIKLPRLHSAQREIVRGARRFNVVCCGRRFGKTKLAVDRLLQPALSGFPAAYFAPTYKMLSEVWREVQQVVAPITAQRNSQEKWLRLITGGKIDFWSLENPDIARGRKYKLAVIDEAAQVAWLEEAWQKVLRPTLTDYQGAAWFFSTPRGLNYFHQIYQQGADPLIAEWQSWQMPTARNPFIAPQEIEAARQELPGDVFQQEYLAEFIQNAGAVFRNVEACLKALPTPPAEHQGHYLIAGVDMAQKQDFTVISVACLTCGCEVELDRFNQISWALQRGRLDALYRKWRLADILVEANSIGSPNLEALHADNLPARGFETTPSSKPPLIQSLALAFERAEFQWLPDPVAKGELLAYEATVSRLTGRVSYSAPEGKHDDTVIARALVNWIRTTQVMQTPAGSASMSLFR